MNKSITISKYDVAADRFFALVDEFLAENPNNFWLKTAKSMDRSLISSYIEVMCSGSSDLNAMAESIIAQFQLPAKYYDKIVTELRNVLI